MRAPPPPPQTSSGNFGTVFVDQSYWQSAVASKPKQGVLGLLLGGLAWFAIPFSFSTTMGLAYVALSAKQGEGLLTDADVDAGNNWTILFRLQKI